MRLRKSKLPRHTRMTDRCQRRCACTVITADDVRATFGYTCSNRANADFGYELHVDACTRVRILQIMDKLSQILDRINIMMRRRRDQANAWRRSANLSNPRIHLTSRKLAAFTGLRALRHLDLNLVRIDQIVACYAETAGSDLLDRTAAGSPFASGMKRAGSSPPSPVLLLPPMRFIAIASVSCASLADGAVGHRTGLEAFNDRFDRFYFFDRNRSASCLEVKQSNEASNASYLHLERAQRTSCTAYNHLCGTAICSV